MSIFERLKPKPLAPTRDELLVDLAATKRQAETEFRTDATAIAQLRSRHEAARGEAERLGGELFELERAAQVRRLRHSDRRSAIKTALTKAQPKAIAEFVNRIHKEIQDTSDRLYATVSETRDFVSGKTITTGATNAPEIQARIAKLRDAERQAELLTFEPLADVDASLTALLQGLEL